MSVPKYQYQSTVKVQPMAPVRSSYNSQSKSAVNAHREAVKRENMKNAAIRREAIKSENLKEPLIKCKTCGMKLGIDTEECPNCGTRFKVKSAGNRAAVVFLILALLVLLLPLVEDGLKAGMDNFTSETAAFFEEAGKSFGEIFEEY